MSFIRDHSLNFLLEYINCIYYFSSSLFYIFADFSQYLFRNLFFLLQMQNGFNFAISVKEIKLVIFGLGIIKWVQQITTEIRKQSVGLNSEIWGGLNYSLFTHLLSFGSAICAPDKESFVPDPHTFCVPQNPSSLSYISCYIRRPRDRLIEFFLNIISYF